MRLYLPRIFRNTIAVLLLATPCAFAMDTLTFSAIHQSYSVTSTVFFNGLSGAGLVTTESQVTTRMPVAGNVKGLYVVLDAAPSAGKSVTFFLRQNSGTPVNGSSCTISGTNTSCNDTVNSITYAAGDTIDLANNSGGSPAAGTFAYGIVFTSATSNVSYIFGGTVGAASTSVSNYISPQSGSTAGSNYNTTVSSVEAVCPTGGTLSQLNINLVTASGAGPTWTWTLFKNGSATALTCQAANATSCQDTTHSVAVVAGDRLALQITPASTPAGPGGTRWSMEWAPTLDGESIQMFSSTVTAQSTSLTQYNFPVGSSKIWNGTESQTTGPSPAITAKKLYVSLEKAPSPGSYAITLRQNSGATALTCTASGASVPTTCNDTSDSVSINASDLLDLQEVPASSPGVTGIHIGWVSCIGCAAPGATSATLRTLLGVGQ